MKKKTSAIGKWKDILEFEGENSRMFMKSEVFECCEEKKNKMTKEI
jgi:hypothetical protein